MYGARILKGAASTLDDLLLRDAVENGIRTVKHWFNEVPSLNILQRMQRVRNVGGGSGNRFSDLANMGQMSNRAKQLIPEEVRWYTDPSDPKVVGNYNNKLGLIGVNPRLVKASDESLSSVIAHEATHKVQFGYGTNNYTPALPDGYSQAAENVLGLMENSKAHTKIADWNIRLIGAEQRLDGVIQLMKQPGVDKDQLFREAQMLGSIVDDLQEKVNVAKYVEYLSKPQEIHARTMQVRHFIPESRRASGALTGDDIMKAFDDARNAHEYNRNAFYFLTDDPAYNKRDGIFHYGHAKNIAEWMNLSPALAAGSALGYLGYQGYQNQGVA